MRESFKKETGIQIHGTLYGEPPIVLCSVMLLGPLALYADSAVPLPEVAVPSAFARTDDFVAFQILQVVYDVLKRTTRQHRCVAAAGSYGVFSVPSWPQVLT